MAKNKKITLKALMSFTDVQENLKRSKGETFQVSEERAKEILAAKHKGKQLAVVVEIEKK